MVAVAFVACAAIGVASLLPSELVADEMNKRIDEVQPTPYARVPSSAQPVDERITFGDLEGLAEQYPPSGDFYFVTVTEPAQTILSWVVGRDEPAIEFLTEEEKFGFQTPQQRRVFGLESMRTSEQVAQYVALKAVGYDVTIVPGDVLISEMVCLVANDEGTECLEWSPSDEVLDPGDRMLEVDGAPSSNVDDLSAHARRQGARRHGGDQDRAARRRRAHRHGRADVGLRRTGPDDRRLPPRSTRRRVELPFELDIDTGRIGGPSAGLAFTLTLIDELTPGELTGGQNIAVTGTIELDGTRRARSAVCARRRRRSPRPGSTCSSCPRHKARTTSRQRGRPGAMDCASSRSPPSTRRWRRSRSWVATRSTPFRLPPTNSPECLRWAAWPSRSRDPTRRRPRPSPRRSSPPPVGGIDQDEVRELLRSVAAELRRSRSARSNSSASCASPSRAPSTAPKDSTTRPSPACSAKRRCTSCRPPARAHRRSRSGPRRVPRASCARPPRTPTASASRPRSRRSRKRTDAAADAEGEVALAKQQGREMVNEARAYRERVLVGARPAARAGPPADRAADPRARSTAAGVRAGAPGRGRRGCRAHAARRARRVRRPLADHRPGADDGARPLVDGSGRTCDGGRPSTTARRPTAPTPGRPTEHEPDAEADTATDAETDTEPRSRAAGSKASWIRPTIRRPSRRRTRRPTDAARRRRRRFVGQRGRAVPRQGRHRRHRDRGPSRHRRVVRPPASGLVRQRRR